MFKIITFNVNSVNMRIEHVIDLIKDQNPDILLLQELKCTEENFPAKELENIGYLAFRNCQKSYNGTAVLVRNNHTSARIIRTSFHEAFEHEARYIEIALDITGKTITIISVYVPNGSEVGSDKYEYKLRFLASLTAHLNLLYKEGHNIIIGGDFNIAPYSIDLADHEKYLNSIGFSSRERRAIRDLMGNNFFDTYRIIPANINKQQYSWFDYRGGALQKNHGMRIDYILSTPNMCAFLHNSYILDKWRFMDKPSDHLPVVAEFDFDKKLLSL